MKNLVMALLLIVSSPVASQDIASCRALSTPADVEKSTSTDVANCIKSLTLAVIRAQAYAEEAVRALEESQKPKTGLNYFSSPEHKIDALQVEIDDLKKLVLKLQRGF